MPLVSIITPVYNAARWLPETLASVCAQTLADWEQILVDDGSTDNSAAIVEAAAREDARFRPLRTPRNLGPSVARNLAIDAARGDVMPASLSVLMSVYGKEIPEFLRQSLESLCCQTLPADEVVLVEDGPLGEELAEVITSFRVRLPILSVKLPVNRGLGVALRAGLDHCRGEFVARMDGDDISVCHRFEKQLAFLEEHPEVDVVGGAIAEFDDCMLTPRAIRRLPVSGARLLKFAKHRNPLNHMTVMFRRAPVIAAGNYQYCPAFEDYHLWSRMLMQGRSLYNLEDILVFARCGNGMQNRRGGLNYIRQEIRMQRLLREMGFLSNFACIRNIFVRTPVRLIPCKLRSLAYRVLLRESPCSRPT